MTDDSTPVGRERGGHARARALDADQRSAIAKQGATVRWSPLAIATHGSSDHPLKIGDIEIPCYVLEGGTRVLSQRGLQGGIGMSSGGARAGEQRMAVFLDALASKGIDIKELSARIRNRIRFSPPGGGPHAYGYEATILADICDVVLAARKKQVLQPQQSHIADRCEILIRGFARVGIIALVDEVTGYQRDRAANSLAKILEAFIAKELQPWVSTFPADYYQELFRLRGLEYPNGTVHRPQYFGILTNDIVYKRLAPGVLDELRKATDRNDAGRPKHKYFQRLTQNIGYPKLREHLGAVIAYMQTSVDWWDFMSKLNRFKPRYGNNYSLELGEQEREDDGRGL